MENKCFDFFTESAKGYDPMGDKLDAILNKVPGIPPDIGEELMTYVCTVEAHAFRYGYRFGRLEVPA